MPHQGTAWYEAAVGRLAGRLLRVANGLVPTDVEKIVDIDLTQIPQLPATHAHYERRLEARLRAERDNARNRTERQEIYIRDWTDLYKLMAEATEANAPLLHRAIHNACDMSHYTPPLPGFDGPRAWNMVLAAMLRTTNRSKSERQYYKIAEYNQTRPEHRLQAGCDPDAFSKRALAFMIHIRPNMPQQYSDQDTADYLFDLLPAAYRPEVKIAQYELSIQGKQRDFDLIMTRCRQRL